jgi:hypothetical protein
MDASMKQQALKAQDGATFCGCVSEVDPGIYCAKCWAELGYLYEHPDSEMFRTETEGIAWIKFKALSRGFDRWHRQL